MQTTRMGSNKQLVGSLVVLLILFIASPLAAQQPSSTEMPQHHGMDGMQGMSGSDGMMKGKAGMRGGGMMCPMMGGGMGTGMMMGMMVLMALFWIAAIFALIALGLFLLRRSRTPVG